MNSSDKNDPHDIQLWKCFVKATERQENASEIDANLLAAYVDGSASSEEIESVESAMARDSAIVELIRELRKMQSSEPVMMSQAGIAAAKKALSLCLHSSGISNKRFSLSVAAAAAAIFLLSFAGYIFGMGTSRIQERTDADLASALAFEMRQEDKEFDLLVILNVTNERGDR